MSSTTRSTTRSSDKSFSLVIFGATGFTGQLITSRLLQNEEVSAKKLKILLAGRSDTKLKQLVKGDERNAHLVDFCVASVDDDESLDKMTSQSKVILNCVGPFSKYGEAVVQSCLRNHCHYLDITGEPAYIQTLISKYDEVARLKKICLVCSCGFDSIPADIGVFSVLKQVSLFNDLDENKNTGFVAVNGYLKLNMPGLISYGTYHTVVTSLDNLSLFGSGKNTKQQKTNENKKPKKKSILKRGIRWEPSVNSYVVPFSTSDPTIVKRSAEVLGYMNDGAIPFEYGHYLQIQKWYNILLLLVVMLFLLLVTRFSWGAKLLLKLWRQPGEGPSEEDRKKSSCELTFEGIATHEKTIQKVTGACVIAGDPGYDETAHMALQSALLMNELYGEEGVNESERRYGVLTPAPVFGQQIVDRLHDNSKVRFIVKENKIIKNTDPSYVEVRREVERLTNIKNFE